MTLAEKLNKYNVQAEVEDETVFTLGEPDDLDDEDQGEEWPSPEATAFAAKLNAEAAAYEDEHPLGSCGGCCTFVELDGETAFQDALNGWEGW